MRVDILTLFPDQIGQWLDHSILARAIREEKLTVVIHHLRQWGLGPHQSVDDTPYGGGAGMVLRADVVVPAIKDITALNPTKPHVILLTPQGTRLTQPKVEELAGHDRLLLVAGHYEGFDERIRRYVDAEISLGDFVLTGGEIAAVALVDAVSRLIPGVLDEASPNEESHSLTGEDGERLLEYPHYTRPDVFDGEGVPEILISGNHAKIAAWRQQQAVERTERAAG